MYLGAYMDTELILHEVTLCRVFLLFRVCFTTVKLIKFVDLWEQNVTNSLESMRSDI